MASAHLDPNEPAQPQAWMLHAKCRGLTPTAFFPSDGLGVEDAQHVCTDCSVRTDCLGFALDNRIDHGVWGGTSERERRRILARRKRLQPTTGNEESHRSSALATTRAFGSASGAAAPRLNSA